MVHEIKNILFLIAIAVFSFVYYLDVRKLPEPEEKNLVLMLLMGLGILLVVETGRSLIRGFKNKNEGKTAFFKDFMDWFKGKQALLLISVVVYVILTPIIGFFVTSFLLLVFLNYRLESRKIWELIVIPLVLLLLIYVLFHILLGVDLPKGFLF